MNLKELSGNKKNCLISLISFDGPKSIVIVLSFILIFLFFFPTENLSSLPVKSLYSSVIIPSFLNDSCPNQGILKNCGFYSIGQTRGVSSILHGNFKQAYNYNPLSFLLLFVMVSLIIVNLFKILKSYNNIK